MRLLLVGVLLLGVGCGPPNANPDGGSGGGGGGSGGGAAGGGSGGGSTGGGSGGGAVGGGTGGGSTGGGSGGGAGGGGGSGGGSASGKWSMGYYAGYQANDYPLPSIEWTGLTHLAVAFYLPAANGTLDETLFQGTLMQGQSLARSLVGSAHTHGVKAIASIGGESSRSAFVGATSAGTIGTFVTNLTALLTTYGYDGVDIDWEPLDPTDQAAAIDLATRLRAAHPGVILTMPVGYQNTNLPDDLSGYPAIAAAYDQLNIMSYGMAGAYPGWDSWHSSALYGAAASTPTSIASTVNLYKTAGVPVAKLGIGIGAYGLCYTPPVTGPSQHLNGATIAASDNTMSFTNIMTSYYSAAAHQFDTTAKAPYLSFSMATGPAGCGFVSYDDAQSIGEKATYLKAQGLGGVIMWTINQNYLPGAAVGQRNPLLSAVATSVLQ